ncbi:hypothetical protein WN51_10315 [Melipona quadrifasciata]|uniref:Uncharacterized protein n=1 Tax=Melipona quadrifasciata TaxID=166423 RepID=A0A0M9A4S4_9HYME|nr:hypothetical protein WN51_10315 [Melipona quadrifasciata]
MVEDKNRDGLSSAHVLLRPKSSRCGGTRLQYQGSPLSLTLAKNIRGVTEMDSFSRLILCIMHNDGSKFLSKCGTMANFKESTATFEDIGKQNSIGVGNFRSNLSHKRESGNEEDQAFWSTNVNRRHATSEPADHSFGRVELSVKMSKHKVAVSTHASALKLKNFKRTIRAESASGTFKAKIGLRQRASWLAPRSHIDTFAPIKGQSPSTRDIHSAINHSVSQFESRRGDTSYSSRDNCIHSNVRLKKPTTGILNISPTAVKGQKREPQRSGQHSSRDTLELRKRIRLEGNVTGEAVQDSIEKGRKHVICRARTSNRLELVEVLVGNMVAIQKQKEGRSWPTLNDTLERNACGSRASRREADRVLQLTTLASSRNDRACYLFEPGTGCLTFVPVNVTKLEFADGVKRFGKEFTPPSPPPIFITKRCNEAISQSGDPSRSKQEIKEPAITGKRRRLFLLSQ